MAEGANLNFCKRINRYLTKDIFKKLVKRGHGLGQVTYFSNFGTPPPNISGMAEDTNLKFRKQIK